MDAFTAKPEARVEVNEGSEGGDFWQVVGGKGDY